MAKLGQFPGQTTAEEAEADHQDFFVAAYDTSPLVSQ
jgi:hypothetical protein